MLNLLKADLKKYLRTRRIYTVLSVNSFMAILSIFLYLHVSFTNPIYAYQNNGYFLFMGSFNPTVDAGLIIGILATSLVTLEFTHGTIRNKIISGYKRWHVYLSITLSTLIVSVSLYVINILLFGGIGSLVLGYGREWNSGEFFRLTATIGLAVVFYTFFILIGIFIGMLIRTTGFAIVTHFFFLVLLRFTVVFYGLPIGNDQTLDQVMALLPIVQHLKLINEGISQNLSLYILISNSLYFIIFTGVGAWLFTRRDIK